MPEFEVSLKGERASVAGNPTKSSAEGKKPRRRIVVEPVKASEANKISKEAMREARKRRKEDPPVVTKTMTHVPREIRTKEHLLAEERTGRNLTQRQKKFCELYVEGTYSNATCARLAGFSSSSASQTAATMLNPLEFPQIAEYIGILQDDREKMYGVSLEKSLKRLHILSTGAEQALQYSAAINAEKIRASLGGLTVDRREVNVINDMSKTQILERLAYLQTKYPQLLSAVKGSQEVEAKKDVDYVEVLNG